PNRFGINVAGVRERGEFGVGGAGDLVGLGVRVLLREGETQDQLVAAAEGVEVADGVGIDDVGAGFGITAVGPGDEAGIVVVERAGERVGVEQFDPFVAGPVVVRQLGLPVA